MQSLRYGSRQVVATTATLARSPCQSANRVTRADIWIAKRHLHRSEVWSSRKPPSAILHAGKRHTPPKASPQRPSQQSHQRQDSPLESKSPPTPSQPLNVPYTPLRQAQDDASKTAPSSTASTVTSAEAVRSSQVAVKASTAAVEGGVSVPGTAKPSAIRRGSQYLSTSDGYWRGLARVAEPTILYKAPSHTQKKVIGSASLISCVCIANFVFSPYAAIAASNTLVLLGGGMVSLFWLSMGTYIYSAPQKLVRTISAVPEKTSLQNPTTGPALLLELEPMLPFMKPRSVLLRAIELSRDAPIEAAVESMLAARQQEKLRFGWAKAFFTRVRSILFDFITIFTRQSFVYVKLPNKGGNLKIELPGVVNYDRGKALEQVLRFDEEKKTMFRKLFFAKSP